MKKLIDRTYARQREESWRQSVLMPDIALASLFFAILASIAIGQLVTWAVQ